MNGERTYIETLMWFYPGKLEHLKKKQATIQYFPIALKQSTKQNIWNSSPNSLTDLTTITLAIKTTENSNKTKSVSSVSLSLATVQEVRLCIANILSKH